MTHIMDKVYDSLYAGTGSLEEVESGKPSVMLTKQQTKEGLKNAQGGKEGSGCCTK